MNIHLLATATLTLFQQRSLGPQRQNYSLSGDLQEMCADPYTKPMNKWTEHSLNAFLIQWEAINLTKKFISHFF